ncbi:MAG: protein translocase subunit SecF [candidate division KSB1 bacterium]|nr:protein translocase subunit SecF [candidate division KSB1 bacterium]MDZ7301304.1 protein translocase subunit SecF [candidate division KSB1 bacterium]MDZ7310811.1 protein translocase subunit SecF [candidate division KSB1 bacterium]
MQFFRETHLDFLGKRKYALMISALLILIGITSLIIKGGPVYGIDFLGGTEIHVRFPSRVPISQVRDAMATLGFGKAEIKQFGSPNELLIRVQQQETGTLISDQIMQSLRRAFPNNVPEELSVESVGPKIGQELRNAAIWAIIISLGLILLYISVRFEFVFALGAVASLIHDVLITLGFFSLLNLEISLAVIAAFLTLVGYSLNDTIVVYDRIRENLKLYRRETRTIEELINFSINQTLSRTILTSLTTLLAVLSLYLLGGEVLHNFSFCMLIGIVVGTYSSIFIAAPIVVEWHKKAELQKLRRGAKVAL